MRSITDYQLRHRKLTLALFAVLLVASLLLMQAVTVNYDLSAYLPEDSMTKQAISEMEDSFGYDGTARVMAEGVSVAEALSIKAQIEAVEGVKSVLWLDDVADVTQPLATLDEATASQFYSGGDALFQVTFAGSDYDISTGDAIEAIRGLGVGSLSMSGNAVESLNMRELLSEEIFRIFLVVVPFCVLILFLASNAWIEPVLILLVLGISILINTGTNAFFPNISFITHAMAAVLQLAISLDYSLFLFHRYIEERDGGKDPREAVLSATAHSLNSIMASALTTIAGFLALVFMQYSIGKDIGLVLAKGIGISLITVMLLMPVLIYLMRNVIDRTRHKRLIPSFAGFGRATTKIRWPLLIVLVIVLIPAFLAQNNNTFLYGDSSGSSQGDTAQERTLIESKFGADNPIALLVPVGDTAREVALAEALEAQPGVKSVQALVTLADPHMPQEVLPEAVVSQFQSDQYSRIVVYLAQSGENEAVSAAVADVKTAVEAAYPGEWLAAGSSTSLDDIKESVEHDGIRVQLLSILAVAVIVALAFKSITIPILLVALIQGAIWINMAVPYFTGTPLVYIGYLVISSLQLGATIDYAILLTNRYMDDRVTMKPREAAVAALSASGPSVLVSTLILAGAGFAEALLSRVPSISAIGMLLGRGALLSGGMVLIVLPPLLCMLDRVLRAGTLKRGLTRKGADS